jgi:hypothetical protein
MLICITSYFTTPSSAAQQNHTQTPAQATDPSRSTPRLAQVPSAPFSDLTYLQPIMPRIQIKSLPCSLILSHVSHDYDYRLFIFLSFPLPEYLLMFCARIWCKLFG